MINGGDRKGDKGRKKNTEWAQKERRRVWENEHAQETPKTKQITLIIITDMRKLCERKKELGKKGI